MVNREKVPTWKMILHGRRITDYLWRSEIADQEFWHCQATGEPSILDSVMVLERWMEARAKASEIRATVMAFIAGALLAILFFLPEILRLDQHTRSTKGDLISMKETVL